MFRSTYSPIVTASISFFILIIAVPLITYATFFKERMTSDPHGLGVGVFVIFVILINPFVSLWVGFGIWLLLMIRVKKLP